MLEKTWLKQPSFWSEFASLWCKSDLFLVQLEFARQSADIQRLDKVRQKAYSPAIFSAVIPFFKRGPS
jgi:hypothetical protein